MEIYSFPLSSTHLHIHQQKLTHSDEKFHKLFIVILPQKENLNTIVSPIKPKQYVIQYIILTIKQNGSFFFNAKMFSKLSLFDDTFIQQVSLVTEHDLHILNQRSVSGICILIF